jgi:hypothetical protein
VAFGRPNSNKLICGFAGSRLDVLADVSKTRIIALPDFGRIALRDLRLAALSGFWPA